MFVNRRETLIPPVYLLRSDGKTHDLRIQAYAAGDTSDFLSYIIVYRNGKIFRLCDVRQKKIREFKGTLPVTEREKTWYVIKVYGKAAWWDPAYLDIVAVCKNKNDYPAFGAGQDRNSVAFFSERMFLTRKSYFLTPRRKFFRQFANG